MPSIRAVAAISLLFILAACVSSQKASIVSSQKASVTRVPASALVIGRGGGVILIHKMEGDTFAIKQCQDFIPIEKEQDCRVAPGSESREVTKDEIVGELAQILQLPRFKPEVSKKMLEAQRTTQMRLFRCADSLSMLKYEIYRRQQFGSTYGFFKEDLSELHALTEKSEKYVCSSEGTDQIQQQIDAVNGRILSEIIALIESDELHVISSPRSQMENVAAMPIETELSGALSRSQNRENMDTPTQDWELQKADTHNPLYLGFKDAFDHCDSRDARLPTAVEFAAYAKTKGAKFLSYDGFSEEKNWDEDLVTISTSEIEAADEPYTYYGYYKFAYATGGYATEDDLLGRVDYIWTSSENAYSSAREIYVFNKVLGTLELVPVSGLKRKMAVVCVSGENRISFKK